MSLHKDQKMVSSQTRNHSPLIAAPLGKGCTNRRARPLKFPMYSLLQSGLILMNYRPIKLVFVYHVKQI